MLNALRRGESSYRGTWPVVYHWGILSKQKLPYVRWRNKCLNGLIQMAFISPEHGRSTSVSNLSITFDLSIFVEVVVDPEAFQLKGDSTIFTNDNAPLKLYQGVLGYCQFKFNVLVRWAAGDGRLLQFVRTRKTHQHVMKDDTQFLLCNLVGWTGITKSDCSVSWRDVAQLFQPYYWCLAWGLLHLLL